MPQFALLNIDGDRDKLMRRSRLLENAGLHTLNAGSVPEAHELLRKHVATVMVVSAELAGESTALNCAACSRNRPTHHECFRSRVLRPPPAIMPERSKTEPDAYLHEPVSDAVLVATVRALTRFWASLEQNQLEIERHRTHNENYQSMQHTLRFVRSAAFLQSKLRTWAPGSMIRARRN